MLALCGLSGLGANVEETAYGWSRRNTTLAIDMVNLLASRLIVMGICAAVIGARAGKGKTLEKWRMLICLPTTP